MKRNKLIDCPLCGSEKSTQMLDLDCGNLNDSEIYRFVKINVCEKCGHVCNCLFPDELTKIEKYGSEESASLNLGLLGANEMGDRPGSESSITFKRHDELYGFISPCINSSFRVLDVGCGTGGFLDYLREKGFNELHGIDIAKKYVDFARKKNKSVKLGNARSIPFADNSMDLLIMDQVLEHLSEPSKALNEAKRVLIKNGLLYIGVPDSLRYNKSHFFDFFWFLIREHVQHFDIEHLKILTEAEGFKLIARRNSDMPVVSEKMRLPNLGVLFRLVGKTGELKTVPNRFKLKKEIKKYIEKSFQGLDKKIKIINKLAESGKPLYVWGIGREFLFLYESAGLKNCNIIGLIDINPCKKNLFLSKGKKISDKLILKKAVAGSALLITAIAHTDSIRKDAMQMNFNGEILEL